ncbi:MAG: carbohydrate ABC transporter permease [Chloroflexota bacterium]|nr:carbohydrate ABC transporter permease [Chloroflexota bacterium]
MATRAEVRTATPQSAVQVNVQRFSVSRVIGRILFWVLVSLIIIYTIFPFFWAVISSITPENELFSSNTRYWPSAINWNFYQYVLENGAFLNALRNSVIVSVVTVLIALALGSLAAYAIGRMKFRGKTPVMYLILSMTMFPQIAILGSLYQIISALGLFDRLPALIIAYLTFTLPFTVWVLANFFRAMPAELEEAALVDGATPFQAFWRILLPLSAPGLVTTGLLAFIAAWNEFLYALTFTQSRARTVQPAIASFSGNTQFDLPWGNILAASVLVTIPLVVLVLIFQRKILAGLTSGAVKG